MEIERIKKVIVDQKEELREFFQREKIIEREIGAEKLRKFLKHPNILIITGPRRSGKSTLATQIFNEKKYGF
ncbi:AAA family ATPase, partial [Patescibacteria group bacterium]|nr:AAA family ATPase [Patescibacteria group bacterium]